MGNRQCLHSILRIAVMVFASSGLAAAAATYYVDANQTNCSGADGSQGNPFCTITEGIIAASNSDTVLVLPGVYREYVSLYGKLITVKSRDGYLYTAINTSSISLPAVAFTNGEGPQSILEGFTIIGGNNVKFGTGIYCVDSSPTIRNNRITNNVASGKGAGLYISCPVDSALGPFVEFNTFDGNSAQGVGGAICILGGAPTIRANIISRNSAASSGGAIFIDSSSSQQIIIDGNVFLTNSSAGSGAGISSGAATIINIANNEFVGNTAQGDGGAIYCSGNSTITDNIFGSLRPGDGNSAGGNGGAILALSSTASINGNSFTHNSASGEGGAVALFAACGSSVSMRHNTFMRNVAVNGGALSTAGGNPVIADNTFGSADPDDGNSAIEAGGAIYAHSAWCPTENPQPSLGCGGQWSGRPTIASNYFEWNAAGTDGGTIFWASPSNVVEWNHILNSAAGRNGGALYGDCGALTFANNIIDSAIASGSGGAVYITGLGTFQCARNLISHCVAYQDGGGGLWVKSSPGNVIDGVTFAHNDATNGDGGGILSDGNTSALSVKNCIFWGNTASGVTNSFQGVLPSLVSYSCIEEGISCGVLGNICSDPLFAGSVGGDYYLSQIAAGQGGNSPCVNAGDPSSPMILGTTRTDCGLDTGFIDMGYHYPLCAFATFRNP